jgi:hypothetical protein
MNKVIQTIPSATMDALCRYHWPGNIRELQNVIERAVILSQGSTLNVDVTDLKSEKVKCSGEKASSAKSFEIGDIRTVLEETERRHILEALRQSDWVVAGRKERQHSGMKRSTLSREFADWGSHAAPPNRGTALHSAQFGISSLLHLRAANRHLPQIRQYHAGSVETALCRLLSQYKSVSSAIFGTFTL